VEFLNERGEGGGNLFIFIFLFWRAEPRGRYCYYIKANECEGKEYRGHGLLATLQKGAQ
jgi:hypothetical protein